MNIVDQCQNFRIIENGCGGYQVERRYKSKWYKVGSEQSHLRNATHKMSRLLGHRDTETPLSEWYRFYGIT